jgi:hypothetical protein
MIPVRLSTPEYLADGDDQTVVLELLVGVDPPEAAPSTLAYLIISLTKAEGPFHYPGSSLEAHQNLFTDCSVWNSAIRSYPPEDGF